MAIHPLGNESSGAGLEIAVGPDTHKGPNSWRPRNLLSIAFHQPSNITGPRVWGGPFDLQSSGSQSCTAFDVWKPGHTLVLPGGQKAPNPCDACQCHAFHGIGRPHFSLTTNPEM